MFGQPLTGFCNSAGGNDCIDSVIVQDPDGNIGIATQFPSARLDVNGGLLNDGVAGSSTFGPGVAGTSTQANGVVGRTGSTTLNTAGVRGEATASSGQVVGVFGNATNSPIGTGVVGIGSATGGFFRKTGTSPAGHALVVDGAIATGLQLGGDDTVCRKFDIDTEFVILSFCSSSLRYKTDVRPFAGGLDIINRLRPIAFTWKQGGKHDIGLAAEDVEKVEPLLTFRNDKGEIEGVRYNQLSAVFVNAFAEQQGQIRDLRADNVDLKARLEALERLVKATQTARSGPTE